MIQTSGKKFYYLSSAPPGIILIYGASVCAEVESGFACRMQMSKSSSYSYSEDGNSPVQ
jgi:hypothetical protein